MKNNYIISADPCKKKKWYHKILKFFGKKIETGHMIIYKKEGESIRFIDKKDTFF